MYSESIAMWPAVLYILYDKSCNEQTGDIFTFSLFENRNLVENERNTDEDKSISDSIDESSTENGSDDESINKNAIKDIWYGIQVSPEPNARYDRLKICDWIIQTKNWWKGA